MRTFSFSSHSPFALGQLSRYYAGDRTLHFTFIPRCLLLMPHLFLSILSSAPRARQRAPHPLATPSASPSLHRLFITYGHGQVNRRSTAVYIDHPPPASWREGIISRILVCILLLSPLLAPPSHPGFVTTSRNSRPRQPCYHSRLRPPVSLLFQPIIPQHPHLPSPIFRSGLISQSRYKIRRTLIRAIGRPCNWPDELRVFIKRENVWWV